MKLPRQARWAVPAGAVAAVGIVIAGSVIAGAQATPRLPARTTAQLIAAVDHPGAVPPAMTAVIQETASLGLPDLPGTSDPLSPLSLLSGSHTFKVWYDGPARVRIAVPVQLGETDLRRDGRSAWLWDSRTNQATHYLLPASPATGGAPPADATPSIPAPQQLARQVLAAVGPTTTVGLQQNVMVAGQPAYQLSLAPKDGRSLIGQVRIAIDARNSLPLQVQVFARGAAGPAFSVGYTSLSFAVPAASNFAFSPPPGAKVKTVTVPGAPTAMPVPAGSVGLGGIVPVVPPAPPGASDSTSVQVIAPGQGAVTVRGGKHLSAAMARRIEASFARSLPASLSKTQRAVLTKEFYSHVIAGPVPGGKAGTWFAVDPAVVLVRGGGVLRAALVRGGFLRIGDDLVVGGVLGGGPADGRAPGDGPGLAVGRGAAGRAQRGRWFRAGRLVQRARRGDGRDHAGARVLGQRPPAAHQPGLGAVHRQRHGADRRDRCRRCSTPTRRTSGDRAAGHRARRGQLRPGPRPGRRGAGRVPAAGARARGQAAGRPGELAVATIGLAKRFGQQLAVAGIDLAVPSGSVYGFLGPNGSGKTTTIRMLLGLIQPTGGSQRLLGVTMPAGANAVLPRVGSLVEGPAFHPQLSGQANLARLDAADRTASPRTAAARIDAALDRVGLLAAAGKRYRAYSLGMKQRLAIAAGLLRPRELMILDEPTNGLDPQGTREVRALIRQIAADGTTVFVSSHLLAEVEQICSHVGVMRAGELVFQGTLEELRGRGARPDPGPHRASPSWPRRCWPGSG